MARLKNVTISLGSMSVPLTIILIVLKVSEIITCSWWLVFLPMYLGLAIVLLICLIAIIILIACALVGEFLK